MISINDLISNGKVIEDTGSATRVAATSAPAITSTAITPPPIQALPEGFGAYLKNILPEDIATAAGAFSASMRQIRNIETAPIEKFAQVVSNIESTKGLPLVAGSDVPVNTNLATAGTSLIALGTGPNGSYTTSDILGSMTALPYPWASIQSGITNLQTSSLASIYRELFLAVTWERATASVQYTTYTDGFGTTYYHVTGVTLTDAGGGYGRGGAAAPTVTMTGGTCTATIGTDDTNAGSNGAGTFGRVTALNFTSGADITTVPTISIDYPPGGSSFSNSIVQGYIDQANAEILSIKNNNPTGATQLNTWYNQTGSQLTIEQQTRKLVYPPVPVPHDDSLSQYPMTLYSFVDTIPTFAVNTMPHMYAQSLEAICDLDIVGGQSIVAMMRENRNEARLSSTGIQLDNNIDGRLTPIQAKTLIANGVLGNTLPATMYPPASPLGYYDPNTNDYIVDGGILDTGAVQEPGSLAASPYQHLIPPELNTAYTSDILPSSVFSVPEAIDEVVKCNCDCWVQ